MFLTKIKYFFVLFLVIIYNNQIAVGVDLTTPRQVECYSQILLLYQIYENPKYKKNLFQWAILYFRFIGPDPIEVGNYSKNLRKHPIGDTAPYSLYSQLTSELDDNPFAVHYYDKIAYYYKADKILTPDAFCDEKDKENNLDIKTVCLHELVHVGFKHKTNIVSSKDLIKYKNEIVEYAYKMLILNDFPTQENRTEKDIYTDDGPENDIFLNDDGDENDILITVDDHEENDILITVNYDENDSLLPNGSLENDILIPDNGPESGIYYAREYFLSIVEKVETKLKMITPDQFCNTYA